MKKKIVSFILAIIICISCSTFFAFAENVSSSEQGGIVASGYYLLRNVGSGKFLDSCGTTYLEQSLDTTLNYIEINHIFKITYLGTFSGEDCYSIRPLTLDNNNCYTVDHYVVGCPYPEFYNNAEYHFFSQTDDYETLGEENVWYISSVGNYYKIKNKYMGEAYEELYGDDYYIDNAFLCSYDDLSDDNIYVDSSLYEYENSSYELWNFIPCLEDSNNSLNTATSFDSSKEYYFISIYRDYTSMYYNDKYLYMCGDVDVSAEMLMDVYSECWKIERYLDTDYYIIKNTDNASLNKCLTVNGLRNGASCSIREYTNIPSDSQLWHFFELEDGEYVIQPKIAEDTNYFLAASFDLTIENPVVISNYNSNTDYTYSWRTCAVGTNITLLEIQDAYHDHLTGLSETLPHMNSLGYDGFNFMEVSVSSLSEALNKQNEIKNKINENLKNSTIFVSRSHGDFDGDGAFLKLWEHSYEDSDGNERKLNISALRSTEIYNYILQKPLINLDGCHLVLFIGCYTGAAGEKSLNNAAVLAGADYAIGFTNTIICGAANDWTRELFKKYDLYVLSEYDIDFNTMATEAKTFVNKLEAYRGVSTNLDSFVISH